MYHSTAQDPKQSSPHTPSAPAAGTHSSCHQRRDASSEPGRPAYRWASWSPEPSAGRGCLSCQPRERAGPSQAWLHLHLWMAENQGVDAGGTSTPCFLSCHTHPWPVLASPVLPKFLCASPNWSSPQLQAPPTQRGNCADLSISPALRWATVGRRVQWQG